MYLTVSEDTKGLSGIINLPIDEACYLEYDGSFKGVSVNTLKGNYYMNGALGYWENMLKAEGFQFQKVDRNVIVNVPKVVFLDPIFKVAYFEEETTAKSIKCQLAWHGFTKIAKEFQLVKPEIIIRRAVLG
ncbi:LytTR family transcriptional regulator DNA-binding domain-containing protein [Paenibacillus xanthanilyticus]|uniref:LytTR family transcriptional regulator DNA-binding domain-containing protein n=1 Tax=Paenibacillus xanthanilyticus TaxID=1783531 RepID=A0ABV8KAR4_9BACL